VCDVCTLAPKSGARLRCVLGVPNVWLYSDHSAVLCLRPETLLHATVLGLPAEKGPLALALPGPKLGIAVYPRKLPEEMSFRWAFFSAKGSSLHSDRGFGSALRSTPLLEIGPCLRTRRAHLNRSPTTRILFPPKEGFTSARGPDCVFARARAHFALRTNRLATIRVSSAVRIE
jgi:hypothetical protein